MNFLEEIRGKYDTLSTVQKRIADYLFTYPEEVCFQSLKEVSESFGVTEVTVLRFAKKVGVGSFVELKKRMKEYLQSRLDMDKMPFRIVGRVGVTIDES
ncbi:MAG: MurR/RpiR family transcriptional regulator, partial [Lachnospiraceae bacterium]|nr:MurR/RpiR family transcriptional regulator [Lachnospiraceae bacterium]